MGPEPTRAAPARWPGSAYDGYNPLTLAALAFRWGGRFDRGQFAIVYFGAITVGYAVTTVLAIVAAVLLVAVGEVGHPALGAVVTVVVLVPLPFLTVMALGAVVRRLRDTGQHPAWALLIALPCVNMLLLIYLVAVPDAESGGMGAGLPAWGMVLIAGFVLLPLVGIMAAIAIPSFLRARITVNESAAIADLRDIASAQSAYRNANDGYFDAEIDCLSTPTRCIPGYTGPAFLDDRVQAGVEKGYTRRLQGGAPAGLERSDRVSPSSTTTFAVEAQPTTPGTTGVRAFCVDHRGRPCAIERADGTSLIGPGPDGGVLCSSRCTPIT